MKTAHEIARDLLAGPDLPVVLQDSKSDNEALGPTKHELIFQVEEDGEIVIRSWPY